MVGKEAAVTTRLALSKYKRSADVLKAAGKCVNRGPRDAVSTTEIRLLAQDDRPRGPDSHGVCSPLYSGLDLLEKRLVGSIFSQAPHGAVRTKSLLRVLAQLLPADCNKSIRSSRSLRGLLKQSIQQAFELGPRALRPECTPRPGSSDILRYLRCLADMIPLEFFEYQMHNVVHQVLIGVIRYFWCYLNNNIRESYWIPANPYTPNKVLGSALTDPASRPQSWSPVPPLAPNERFKAQGLLSAPDSVLGYDGEPHQQSTADTSAPQKSPRKSMNASKQLTLHRSASKDVSIDAEDENGTSMSKRGKQVNGSDKSLPGSQEKASPSKRTKNKPPQSITGSEESLPATNEQANSPKKRRSKSGTKHTESLPAKKHNDPAPLLGSAAAPIMVDPPQESNSFLVKREPSPLFLDNDTPYSGGLGTTKISRAQSALESGPRPNQKTASQLEPSSQQNSAAEGEQSSENEEEQSSGSEEEYSSESDADEPSERQVSVSHSIDHSGKKRKRSEPDGKGPNKKKQKDAAGKPSVIAPEIDRRPKHPHSSEYDLAVAHAASKKSSTTPNAFDEDSDSDEFDSTALAPVQQPRPREKILNKAGRYQQKPLHQGPIYQGLYLKERAKTSHYETILKETGITQDMLAEMVERLEQGSTARNAVNTVKTAYKRNNG